MQVWNVLHAVHWKYGTQKNRQKFAVCTPSHNSVGLYFRNKFMYWQSEKNLLNSNISFTCPHNMANFGPLTAEIVSQFGAAQQIATGFASWLRYCRDVIHRRPTKLCTMFGRLLGCCTMYTFSGAFACRNFARCKLYYASKSCVLLCIGSVTAQHSSRGHQPDFAAWYKKWNYGTFTEGATYIRLGGHHVGHRPTF